MKFCETSLQDPQAPARRCWLTLLHGILTLLMPLRYQLSFSQQSNRQCAIGDMLCLDLRSNETEPGRSPYSVVEVLVSERTPSV